MYHAIVKRIARQGFERVNDHRYDALVAGCAPDIRHRFGGTHALGGERHDREALRQWFERLGRICPTLRLTVDDVWATGLPHDTTVVARWHTTQDMPDGSVYANHGVHVIRLRWGRAVEIDANEDSQAVVAMLQVMAEHGCAEALAPPITS